VWINNQVLPALPYMSWWPEMPAEVAVALAPLVVEVIARWLDRE